MAAKKKHTLRETSAEMCRIADTYKDGFEKMSKKCRNASEKVKTPELRRRLEKLSSKYLDAAQTVRENKAHYLETIELSLITGDKEFVTQSVKDDGLSMIKSFSNLDSKLFKEYHDIERDFIEKEKNGNQNMKKTRKSTAGQKSLNLFAAPKAAAKKAAPKRAKKTTKKTAKKLTPLMRVRKLVSEGKVKSGFVSRLGVRKQTPPPPKSKKADRKRRALNAGYRVSKSGNLYYESRENRSDTPHGKPRRGRKAPAKRGRK